MTDFSCYFSIPLINKELFYPAPVEATPSSNKDTPSPSQIPLPVQDSSQVKIVISVIPDNLNYKNTKCITKNDGVSLTLTVFGLVCLHCIRLHSIWFGLQAFI
jgi:hypothetical protein